jgi:hypothetical protein
MWSLKLNFRRLLVLVPLAAVVVIGCGGSGNPDEQYFYRLTNAVPFLSNGVDFMVNKEVSTSGVAYGSDTPFVETDLEEPNIFYDVLDSATHEFLDSIVAEKSDEVSLHLFAVGIKNGPVTLQPIAQLAPVIVNRTTPQGNARLVFVNGYCRRAGVQTPHVDLIRSGQIQPVIADIAFAGSSTFVLPAGTYTFSARYAGLMSGTFLTSPPQMLDANKVYIVLLQGVEDAAAPHQPEFRIFEEPIRDP